jgi:subtilisin family serine protease
MAIIDNRAPEGGPAKGPVRLVVKLKEGGRVAELRRTAREADFVPYFDEPELRAAKTAPFDRYVAATMPDRNSAESLARKLAKLDMVEDAYAEGGPTPPPVNPADDPRNPNQGYLDAAPDGIDARWAWNSTDGLGVGFVDLERGWTLNHEDLAAANITLISGLNQDFFGHGTSVLGEVVAVDNAIGGVGIAPRARARVVSQWRGGGAYNTAAAILSAGQAMSRGDVLLLEAQTSFNGTSNLPVEVETAAFDAIRHVIDNDRIIVVEAAGNGSQDLDAFRNNLNRAILDRTSNDFRDSGAIMVGAASSTTPHSRLAFSNFGNRIDCFGWGQGVDTPGDGWQGNLTNSYTAGFGGTSSASPIVAGAAVLLQSWRKARDTAFEADAMRSRLSSTNLNTASANPANDRIGVLPNLRAIIENEVDDTFAGVNVQYVLWVYILFGIIDDSPGMIWIPGKGPVPVDPDWRPALRIPGAKPDLLAALAAGEIAGRITDPASRKAVNDAAVEAMRSAVERIGRGG